MSGKSKHGRNLSCKRRESSDDDIYDTSTQALDLATSGNPSENPSTPVRVTNPSEDEESPYFPCSTQELQDEVDVLWKWNSPQMKQFMPRRHKKKRLLMQSSPKIPLRRHPSADAQTKKDFEKLREELRALREELNQPDDEESLVLSPREEREIKDEVTFLETSAINELIHEPWESDPDDVFNDDMDDMMIQCSQQVEEVLKKSQKCGNAANNVIVFNPVRDNTSPSCSGSSCNFSEKKNPTLTNQPTTIKPKSITNLEHSSHAHRNLSPALSDLIKKPKFSFKKSSPSKQNLSPSQDLVRLDPIFQPLVEKDNHQKISERNGRPECRSEISESNRPNPPPRSSLDNVFDDSFDMILSQMADDDLEQLTQVVDIKTHSNNLNPSNNHANNIARTLTNTHLSSAPTLPSRQSNVVGTSTNALQRHRSSESMVRTSTNSLQRHQSSESVVRPSVPTNKQPNTLGPSTKSLQRHQSSESVVRSSTNTMAPSRNAGANQRPLSTDTVAPSRNTSANQRPLDNSTNKKSNVFPRCNSEGVIQTVTGKVEFHRTQSFEICSGAYSGHKFESDKTGESRTNLNTISEYTDSPIKCSPEEIEKKRLAALAKREAKKQKEIIEKNRQEALKRLEEKRKKNAQQVKSSLVKRL